MNPTKILTTTQDRHDALEYAKEIIMRAGRRGLEATCEIAEQLWIIDEQQLYEDAGCFSLQEYAQKELNMSRQTMERIRAVGETIESIKNAELRLPDNESQVAALTMLPLEERAV